MAEIIPALNRQTLARMTAGEKRLARRLEQFLEDDYLVWYDIPVGRKPRYPDFIILHPSRGLLLLEVKDWKQEHITKINPKTAELLTASGPVTLPHPLEQARQYQYHVVDTLSGDPLLRQEGGTHRGKLIMPWGCGVVFTNITRQRMYAAAPVESRETLLPDHLVLYQDDIREDMDAEAFQEKLWNMFIYRFGGTLTLPQIDRIRWHLFPEIRIATGRQESLFAAADDGADIAKALPDIIKIMDLQQEQLARSLGEGHRVIHGVAGSGKTLILGYRCQYLAALMEKPILVLCFNITLAAKLRRFIEARGIDRQVHVYHFHDWCTEQLRTYHVDRPAFGKSYVDKLVETVIHAVDQDRIPRAQYGALMIDEGHDFEESWLKLVVQMVDPETDSVLLLYDDAQSIYKNRTGLNFSLSSVGIKARGRTTILRLNYRNTREILRFAYRFAAHYLKPQNADDDHIPLIAPEAAGNRGPAPEVRRAGNFTQELDYAVRCIQRWHEDKVAWADMAVLYDKHYRGDKLRQALKRIGIPCLQLANKENKSAYDPAQDRVSLMTLHSSKGLEFQRVIIVGVGDMEDREDTEKNARLLYVGMTRAQEDLVMTTSGNNSFSRQLLAACAAPQ